jgi:exodeoxyribonuclease VII large subunit
MLEERPALTVSALTDRISRILQGDPDLSDITVTGELSNFIHHVSGHMYFTLKDKTSSIKGVMFRTWNRRLPFVPENGQHVYVRGDVVVYKKGGNYQLNVYGMEPAGQGALALAFAQLKERLAAEGLFAEERKLPLPRFPRRVGLVTSPQGAALQDFLVTAAHQAWPVTFELAPATVQGAGGASSVVAALELLNRRQVDVIVITRGGGSLEELWVFNEEKVARAVAASRVPVVSAIGHETDFTICDFAASARAATPTAAARLVIPDGVALRRDLARQRRRLHRGAAALVRHRRERLDNLAQRSFLARPLQILLQPRQNLDQTVYRFRSAFSRQLEQRRHALAGFAARLADLNPMAVLGRGFAVVRAEKGIIKTVRQLSPGQTVTLQFQDGEAEAIIQTLEGE